MKFTAAIVIFNTIVVLFMAFVFLIPFAVLGTELAMDFLRSSWILAPILIVFLGALDLYFACNYKVLVLLEKEDWPALVQELEHRVLHKERYSARMVKLLTNAYLVLSDAAAVSVLEKKLAAAKPALVNANVLVFGAARLLAGNNRGAVEFFGARQPGGPQAAGTPAADREWLSWYYGFALLLNREFEAAADRFILLTEKAHSGIIAGLSLYFLGDTLRKFLPARNLDAAAETARERVRNVVKSRVDWNREVKRLGTELHAVVLSNYLGKAANYIYGAELNKGTHENV